MRRMWTTKGFYQCFIVILSCVTVTACGGSTSSTTDSGTTETTETTLKEIYLSTGIDELYESGCITDGAIVTSLKAALATSVDSFTTAVTNASGAGLCETGKTLLNAIAASSAEPYYETSRILFDNGGDGCNESFFSINTNTITEVDADADGCLDSLMSYGDILDRLLAEAEQASIAKQFEPQFVTVLINQRLLLAVQILLWHLFPLVHVADLAQYPDYNYGTYRAQAGVLLDDAVQAVHDEVAMSNAEVAAMLTAYLENTQPFVDEFSGCTDTGSGAEADIIPLKFHSGKDITVTRLVCVYASSTHGWISLEAGSDRHVRGFYKGTRGNKTTAPGVPTVGKGDGTLGWFVGVENPRGAGYVSESDKTNSGYRICWEITETQWDTLANGMNADITTAPEYYFFGHNCLGWVAKILALIGKVPPSYTTCGVADPGGLKNALQAMAEKGEKPEDTYSVEKYDAPPEGR